MKTKKYTVSITDFYGNNPFTINVNTFDDLDALESAVAALIARLGDGRKNTFYFLSDLESNPTFPDIAKVKELMSFEQIDDHFHVFNQTIQAKQVKIIKK